MHDCPQCQVPLHGHESFCPACGMKQNVRTEYRTKLPGEGQSSFNPIPWVLGVLVIGGIFLYAVQNSWIGQMVARGPVKEEVVLSVPAAREQLESSITQNLASTGSTGKLVYTAQDKEVDRNYPEAVELAIHATLPSADVRRSIIDPVKQLMDPAKISTITMDDSRSHATWTYTIAPSSGGSDSDSQ